MIRLIQFLIFGHVHKWKIIREYHYADYEGEPGKTPLVAKGVQHTLQCEHCGKLKVFKE